MDACLFFLKGIILGFSIAAPVGPIGILCIRRTLNYGRWSGFFSGLGAATADALYGAIAAFGLTAISTGLIQMHFWLKLIGGITLLRRKFSQKALQWVNKLAGFTIFLFGLYCLFKV